MHVFIHREKGWRRKTDHRADCRAEKGKDREVNGVSLARLINVLL